jgi:hypothetical protein
LAPIVPSSASTDTPSAWAASVTARESATFSSKGIIEASIITDVKPYRKASSICSKVAPWSQCTAIGTVERWARSTMPVTISGPMCRTSSGWIATIRGASVSSLISTMPWNIAQSLMLKAGTAKLCSFATSRIALPVVSMGGSLLLTGVGVRP